MLYAKPHDELTDADGMRLGELRRHCRRKKAAKAARKRPPDAAILPGWLDVPGASCMNGET